MYTQHSAHCGTHKPSGEIKNYLYNTSPASISHGKYLKIKNNSECVIYNTVIFTIRNYILDTNNSMHHNKLYTYNIVI